MKKIILLACAGIVLLAGCKEENYQALVAARCDRYCEDIGKFKADTTLSEEQKDILIHDEFEKAKADISAIVEKALSKHDDDSIAVNMVRTLYEFELTDAEGLMKAIDNLGPKARNDEHILLIVSKIDKLEPNGEGTMFKDFTIVQPDGKSLSLSDFAGCGKYCLVDFWASWCGPCKREIPTLKKVYEKYGPKGLAVVSVAVWDDPMDSADTAKVYGITWNQILNARNVPTELYDILGIPHIMLIGPDGIILKRDLRGEEIEKAVSKYF